MSWIPQNIPNGWIISKIGDITEIIRGASPRPKGDPKYFGGNIPWIMIADVSKSQGRYIFKTRDTVTEAGALKSRYLKSGTLILSNSGTVCVPKILAVDGCIHDGFVAFPNLPEVLNIFYLYDFFNFIRPKIIQQHKQGVTQVNLNTQIVRNIPLPLPPLNEQKRIVGKIEALQKRSQRVKEAIDAIPQLLDQFRQSVLAAAFRGDLTADWRENNPDVEPASVLLEKIRTERRRKWEEAELEKMKAKGKVPKDDKWKQKYKEPPSPNQSNLPLLIDGWAYSFLEPLLSIKRTGLKTGPFGSLLKKDDYRVSGIPIIGIENISSIGFVKGNKNFLDESKARELTVYDAKEGDIIISRSGTVGEVCVIPPGIGEAIISTNLIRLCLAENTILPDYFCFLFRGSTFILNQVSELCSGSTRDFLNQTILSNVVFPIPPLEEQKEIVRIINELFEFAQKIEYQEIEINQSLNLLNQSILSKAFRGELVPQNPNDEPASILLERIRAEREKLQQQTKAVKKSKGKTTKRRSKKAPQKTEEGIQLELPGMEE